MDLRASPEEAAFRAELRAWLAENAYADGWGHRLHEAGYAGLTWPVGDGGRGLPDVFESIFLEECERAEAPELGDGLAVVGPALVAHGSAEQRRRHLPPILRGEAVWTCDAGPGDAFRLVLPAEPGRAAILVTGPAGAPETLGTAADGVRIAEAALSARGRAALSRSAIAVRRLAELARDRGASPTQRDALARCWIELEALRLRSRQARHGPLEHAGALRRRIASLGLELLGQDAGLAGENAPYGGWWQRELAAATG